MKKFKIPKQGFEKIPPLLVDKRIAKETGDIIRDIKNSKIDDSLIDSLSNYVVIRLVSLIERFCKVIVKEAINSNKFDLKELIGHDDFTIRLIDLDTVFKKNLSVGEIVSYNFNFQNWSDIKDVFSKLLGKNFLESLNFSNEGFHGTYYHVILKFNINDFTTLLQTRHKIVHGLSDEKISLKQLENFFASSLAFTTLTFFILNYD